MSISICLKFAGDGDLGDRIGQFAVLDPQARRPARVIAGYDVYAEAHQFGDVEARADASE